MPLTKLTCPECSAILKPSKPVPEGKTIKCPKCSKSFVASGDQRQAVQAKPGAKKPAAGAPVAKPADDEEDGEGVYSFREEPVPAAAPKRPKYDDEDDEDEDEEDDEEAKAAEEKRRMYMLDDSVKDPRGPAQEAVIKPSNILMLTAIVLIALQFFSLFIWAFPFIFAEHLLEPKDVLKKATNDGRPVSKGAKEPEKEWKDLTETEKQKMQDAVDVESERRLLWMIPNVCGIIWGSIVVLAAYKMQNMESYPWSWVGAVMMALGGGFMVNGLWWLKDFMMDMDREQGEGVGWGVMGVAAGWCVLVAVIVMITLKREVVKTGFYWVPE